MDKTWTIWRPHEPTIEKNCPGCSGRGTVTLDDGEELQCPKCEGSRTYTQFAFVAWRPRPMEWETFHTEAAAQAECDERNKTIEGHRPIAPKHWNLDGLTLGGLEQRLRQTGWRIGLDPAGRLAQQQQAGLRNVAHLSPQARQQLFMGDLKAQQNCDFLGNLSNGFGSIGAGLGNIFGGPFP